MERKIKNEMKRDIVIFNNGILELGPIPKRI